MKKCLIMILVVIAMLSLSSCVKLDGTVTIKISNFPDAAPLVTGGVNLEYGVTELKFICYTDSSGDYEETVTLTGPNAQWESPVLNGGDGVWVDVEVYTSTPYGPDYYVSADEDYTGYIDGNITFSYRPSQFEIW